MSSTTVAVRGRYEDTLGRPAKGLVKFLARPAVIYDGVDLEFIVGQSRTVHLDAAGAFTAALQPTDDPDAIPTGWTYEVQEWIAGRLLRPAFDVDVPIAAAPSGIELGVVAPASPSSGDATTWVTLVAFNAAIATEQTARAAGDAATLAAALRASAVAVVDNGDGTVSFYTAAPPRALVVDVGDGTVLILTTDYSVVLAIDNGDGTITFPITVPSLVLVTDNGDGTLSLAA